MWLATPAAARKFLSYYQYYTQQQNTPAAYEAAGVNH